MVGFRQQGRVTLTTDSRRKSHKENSNTKRWVTSGSKKFYLICKLRERCEMCRYSQIYWCPCWEWLEGGEAGGWAGLWSAPQVWRHTAPVHTDQEESWTGLKIQQSHLYDISHTYTLYSTATDQLNTNNNNKKAVFFIVVFILAFIIQLLSWELY